MAKLRIDNFPDSLYAALKARADRQHRSVAEEATQLLADAIGEQPLSILDLQGLGRELWQGMDAAAHVAEERDAWG
jgi:plasmid stability protein